MLLILQICVCGDSWVHDDEKQTRWHAGRGWQRQKRLNNICIVYIYNIHMCTQCLHAQPNTKHADPILWCTIFAIRRTVCLRLQSVGIMTKRVHVWMAWRVAPTLTNLTQHTHMSINTRNECVECSKLKNILAFLISFQADWIGPL